MSSRSHHPTRRPPRRRATPTDRAATCPLPGTEQRLSRSPGSRTRTGSSAKQVGLAGRSLLWHPLAPAAQLRRWHQPGLLVPVAQLPQSLPQRPAALAALQAPRGRCRPGHPSPQQLLSLQWLPQRLPVLGCLAVPWRQQRRQALAGLCRQCLPYRPWLQLHPLAQSARCRRCHLSHPRPRSHPSRPWHQRRRPGLAAPCRLCLPWLRLHRQRLEHLVALAPQLHQQLQARLAALAAPRLLCRPSHPPARPGLALRQHPRLRVCPAVPQLPAGLLPLPRLPALAARHRRPRSPTSSSSSRRQTQPRWQRWL